LEKPVIEISDLQNYIHAGREAIELLKNTLLLLPKGAPKDEIEKKIQHAEQILKGADCKLAKDLGMKLCECTFPPQIMLWKEREQAHVCPNPECGARKERPKPVMARGATWGTSRRG
jgi:hypothetical protein